MLRRRMIIAICITAVALAAGCRSRSDLVEAELRVKDRQLRELSCERDRLSALNDAFANTLRNGPARPQSGGGGGSFTDVKGIDIGRGTGGIDDDNCSGDEGILVVIVPRDSDGSAVKANGQARVTALQVSPGGLKAPLSQWDVSPAYLRRNWKTGLLSSGYFVSLPWQTVPMTEQLKIVVQFQTLDGAWFEADRVIQVRLPHLRGEPPPKPLDPGIMPSPPAQIGVPTLIPAPQQFDPTAPLPAPTPWSTGPNIESQATSQKLPVSLGRPIASSRAYPSHQP